MSLLTSYRWAWQQTWLGMGRDCGLFVLACALSALALSIPLFITSIFYGLSEPIRALPTQVEITVFIDKGIQAETLSQAIKKLPGITGTLIISKDKAFADLNTSLGIKQTKKINNPLPDIIIATVSSQAKSVEIEKIAAQIEKLKGTDMVAFESTWQEKLNALTTAANLGIACLGVVVLSLVILVLAAAIRMTTLSGKNELRALFLFGATPTFAIRPYAWRGMLLMGAASLIAIGITKIGLILLSKAVMNAASLYEVTVPLSLPPLNLCLGFIAIAGITGGFVASLAARDSWRKVH